MAPLQNIPPWAIAVILCLLIATFTECTSNVATATLFLPVLASMVSSLTAKNRPAKSRTEEKLEFLQMLSTSWSAELKPLPLAPGLFPLARLVGLFKLNMFGPFPRAPSSH